MAGQDHALTPVLKRRNGIMTKEKRPVPDVRITNQFRRGKAMVYDFFCKGETRLTIEIAPNEDPTHTFTAGAHARQTPELPDITEPGSTRGEALRAVGRAWAAKNGDIGFPTVDWDLVGQALVAVRAIEAASGLGAIA
jgi:hypothetical protein